MSVRPLSKELQEKAIKELNEDPKRTPEDLKYIKEWLSKQPHITARTDDQFLLSFLRGCKFSLERTKEKLDMYHTFKTITPELFLNRDPLRPEIQKILALGMSLPLPKLQDPAAPSVILVRTGLMSKHNINFIDAVKVNTMIQDIQLLEDDNDVISGGISINDLKDLSLSYTMSVSLSTIKKVMTSFQEGYPVRIKGINFINAPSMMETLNVIFRPFLSEKLKKRMFVHSDLEDLYKEVPKSILPEEYGGDGGKIDDLIAHWKSKIESYRDWFLEDEKYKTDEKKRPGKPKSAESVFGVEGSFRKLSVD